MSAQRLRLPVTASFVLLAVVVVFAVTARPLPGVQQSASQQTTPADGGGADAAAQDALIAAAAGTSVPMSIYVTPASKDGKTYINLLVGGNPALRGPFPVTVEAVLVPLIIQVGATVFDPTAADGCDNNVSAVTRFRQSPIVHASELKFNGIAVGKYQYVDAFMRAEFWNETGGSPSYSNPIKWSFAPAFLLPPFVGDALGVVQGTGCDQYGLVSKPVLDEFLTGIAIPLLQSTKVIGPNQLAAFLVRNVAASNSTPLTDSCCIKGFHNAIGSPAQTYAVMDFNTSTNPIFGAVHDITTASHELAEWMNDPLLTNATPAWGGTGQVGSCDTTLEVGDPLTGTVMHVKRHGYRYHPQEMAFFSWFYNARHDPSLGAGGVFSSHGTFAGPAKNCPPGGSF